MSFSSKVKEEILNSLGNKKDKKNLEAEKFGEYLPYAKYKSELEISFSFYFDISNLREIDIKSILKGVFLSSGCIINPKQDYHFEILFKNKACAEYIYNLLSVLEFTPKIIKRKNNYILYIKDSNQISLILSLLEANASLLYFEQIRVEKEVKNASNRNKNCQSANMVKTINSAYIQLQAIEKIKNMGKFESLNDKLKYTAYLRESYKDKSLDYISKMTEQESDITKRISKSGLKHRLDKLVEIANDL